MEDRALIAVSRKQGAIIVIGALIVIALALFLVPGGPFSGPSVPRVQNASQPSTVFMQSYAFPLDDTGANGTLVVNFRNNWNTTINFDSVYLNGTQATSDNSELHDSCKNIPIGGTCNISLEVGSTLPCPAEGDKETLQVVDSSGTVFTFSVTADSSFESTY